jgi:hypothetical protein
MVEQNRAGTCRALIKRENVFSHISIIHKKVKLRN